MMPAPTPTLGERMRTADILWTALLNTDATPPPHVHPDARVWTVTFTRPGREQLVVPFYAPLGEGAPPLGAEVLDCLLSDALSWADTVDLADFMREYGLTDVRQAEHTYKACHALYDVVVAFLGADFDAFAYDTVRGE